MSPGSKICGNGSNRSPAHADNNRPDKRRTVAAKYAETEVTDPRRMLTTTIRIKGGLLPLLPVVSADVLPKGRIADCVAYLRNVTVEAPVKAGEIIVHDILGLGVDIVASREM